MVVIMLLKKVYSSVRERSEGFKKIGKKQIPQTTVRRGLARMTKDMVKKNSFIIEF